MKNAARARSVTVEIDGWMLLPARGGWLMKMLFRVAAARVEHGQPKLVCAERRPCLVAEIARRWCRCFQEGLFLVHLIERLNRYRAPNLSWFFLLRLDWYRFPDRRGRVGRLIEWLACRSANFFGCRRFHSILAGAIVDLRLFRHLLFRFRFWRWLQS